MRSKDGIDKSAKKVDQPTDPVNTGGVDTLMDRVVKARIELLRARLNLVIKQRDNFTRKYFDVAKIPYHERKEIVEEINREFESAGSEND
jgi:hypothetical protein